MGPAKDMQGFADLTDALPGEVLRLAQWLWGLLPFDAGSRLHWTGLAAFFLLGSAAWLLARRSGRADAAGGLAAFLVPRHMYLSQSSLVDVKVYFANKLIEPAIGIVSSGVQLAMVVMVASAVGSGLHTGGGTLGWPMLILATLLATLAGDLAYYVTHRVHHEHPVLWPFHKLHHSAEFLTPLTAKRNHPVYELLFGIVNALFVAPVMGVIFGIMGVFDTVTVLGLGVFILVFNAAGGALRHSHIWIDYGPVLSRIFISPAQHQIHHSCAVQHHDKNYGLIFAFWDWMFGTLYVPQGRETLEFGVADASGVREAQVHTSLVSAYLVPFSEAGEALRARGAAGGVMAE